MRLGHAGIVACTFDPDFPRQTSRIVEALGGVQSQARVIRVNRPNH